MMDEASGDEQAKEKTHRDSHLPHEGHPLPDKQIYRQIRINLGRTGMNHKTERVRQDRKELWVKKVLRMQTWRHAPNSDC